MLIGYARVSKADGFQSLDPQCHALVDEGVEPVSNRQWEQRELDRGGVCLIEGSKGSSRFGKCSRTGDKRAPRGCQRDGGAVDRTGGGPAPSEAILRNVRSGDERP